MKLASDITAEDLKVFLEEAEEQLRLLDEDIIKLEKEGGNASLLQEIFRAAHTLKGSSAVLGHQRMSELAHAMESVFDKFRKGTLSPNSQVIDALLHSLDALQVLKEELVTSKESNLDITATVAALDEAAESSNRQESTGKREKTSLNFDSTARDKWQAALESAQFVYQIKVTLDKESSWAAVRCFQVITELSQIGTIITSSPTQKEIEEEKVGHSIELIFASLQDEAQIKETVLSVFDIESVETHPLRRQEDLKSFGLETAGQVVGKEPRTQMSQTVRIDVERLDSIMNMVGELVVASTRIVEIGKVFGYRYKEDDLAQELEKSTAHYLKVVNELQEDVMRIRMLPIGTVFNGFPRMVRDLAQKANKKVDFIIEGQETGIDRTVIEHIRDPLVHLLRNAVDHGVEMPEQRRQAGKPETGTIRLAAYREENCIVITTEDNGKGIDHNAIKSSAVKKGFINAEEASRLSDDEALELIFQSGLSTVEKATEVSGRGVGLDIVRRNIESLNGFVKVETKVAKGTKFTLRLPLTLATLKSLLVSCNNSLYAIPLISVLETTRLHQVQIQTIAKKEVIRLRNSVLPLLRLNTIFGLGTESQANDDWIFIVVARADDKLVGLAVDSLIGKQEIVIKSLGEYLGDVKGISGASILGDGQVALILDIPTLVKSQIIEMSRSQTAELARLY